MPRRAKPNVPEIVGRLEQVYGRPRFISRFDPMEELVSCILSQHTADANSFPAFRELREAFPDWADVVSAGPDAVAPVIRRAGLANQKAKAIVRALEAIHRAYGEYTLEPLRELPTLQARDWLMTLPGVGPKTASIVLCFAFGREAIPVDTHVFRVSGRLGLLAEKDDEKKAHDRLLAVVPGELAFRFHVALIQHGRKTCRAPIPVCAECPLTDLCPWFKAVGPEKAKAAQRAALRAKRSREP